jgi:hypothetical protein
MSFQPCRYLRYKELYSQESVVSDEDNIPSVAHAWCNLTLKEVGRDDCPVSMTTCSRPGRICYLWPPEMLRQVAKTTIEGKTTS